MTEKHRSADRVPEDLIDRLLQSPEPCIRYRILVDVLGEKPNSLEAVRLRDLVRESDRAGALLSATHGADGRLLHPYRKWNGAHWVLPNLADMGYPEGDTDLIPLREAGALRSGNREAERPRSCMSGRRDLPQAKPL